MYYNSMIGMVIEQPGIFIKTNPINTYMINLRGNEKKPLEYEEESIGTHIFRRVMHIAMSLAVIYYILPYIIYGIPRMYIMIVLMGVVPAIVELLRLKLGFNVYGLRDHEKNSVASYFWFITGAALLFAIFPQQIAIPILPAVAIGDVVIGETRHLRRRYWISIGVVVCMIPFLLYGYNIWLGILAGLFTFFAESIQLDVNWQLRDNIFKSRSRGTVDPIAKYFKFAFHLDDDMIMQIVPATILLLIFFNFPQYFPAEAVHPIMTTWP